MVHGSYQPRVEYITLFLCHKPNQIFPEGRMFYSDNPLFYHLHYYLLPLEGVRRGRNPTFGRVWLDYFITFLLPADDTSAHMPLGKELRLLPANTPLMV
jgi:hypothetical protein